MNKLWIVMLLLCAADAYCTKGGAHIAGGLLNGQPCEYPCAGCCSGNLHCTLAGCVCAPNPYYTRGSVCFTDQQCTTGFCSSQGPYGSSCQLPP